ncbi:helix-turn-helix domain-containing protein [Agrobacterium rosae]|uniref:Helix-turn-helix domain-containing protein n=1 Tax=Agrobacterium rosae TaxID=1972867 RepID=A0AAW9F7Z6_9HYPH|nr:helix-turn-helix domain-containing protein [Agrobacterium rosae]MDX8301311.1 hypothetical protein [Agrobacterium rosae]
MTVAKRKPERREYVTRATVLRSARTDTVTTIAAKRNDQHLALSQEPHIWRKALMATDLPASSFRVALAIVDIFVNRRTGACFPSLETIAATCRLSVSGAKKGLSALREAGLIFTEKRRFNGSNTILLCLPQLDRKDLDGSVRISTEKTETGPSIVPIPVHRRDPPGSDISTHLGPITLEDNLSNEPSKETDEKAVIPCGPNLPVVAFAPPVDAAPASLYLPASSNVSSDGPPSDFHPEEEKKEDAIRCPTDPAEQREIVKAISGEPGKGSDHVNHQLLALLRSGKLTESVGATLVAAWKQRGTENAA